MRSDVLAQGQDVFFDPGFQCLIPAGLVFEQIQLMQDPHGFGFELLAHLLVLAFGKLAHGLVEFDFLDAGQ